MKAARIHAYGHSDQVHVENIPSPDPSSTEVLVRIRAAGINPIDWKIREGYRSAKDRSLPFTLGQDFCGEVLALGADVEGVEAGDEVYGFANGTYAEYAAASPEMFASKPLTVDDVTAAGLPTPGLTALQIVERYLRPTAGQKILIHGAGGAVGSIATQLCIARGAEVIANASGSDAEYLASLGVTRVIDHLTQRFDTELSDVDGVIDVIGGDTFERSLGVVRAGGMIVSTVGGGDAGGRPVHVVAMWMKKNRADLVTLARLVDQGVITPRHARTVALDDAGKGQDLVQSGHPAAKIVLDVATS